MNLNLEVSYETLPAITYNQLEKLHNHIFDSNDNLLIRLSNVDHPVMILAYMNHELIAYKIGYQLNDNVFYSWIGGVHPDHRKKGIAQILMDEQQKLVKQQGYRVIQTKTMNKWKSMLLLNIKNDFKIIETYYDKQGLHKILLEKSLD